MDKTVPERNHGSHNTPDGGCIKEGPSTHSAEETQPKNPGYYINRELSWLRFNERVLEEAKDATHPLLERVKFLAICGSNLDEFFMIRVSGLIKQVDKGVLEAPPDRMTPKEQLAAIRKEVSSLLAGYAECWKDDLVPALSAAGIRIRSFAELDRREKRLMREYFENVIFPVLTPQAVDVTHPFPLISNLSLNLAVTLKDSKGEKHARVKVPTRLFTRLVQIPSNGEGRDNKGAEFLFMEDLIRANLDLLFPGMEITGAYPLRITRNAEIGITLDEASDLLTAIEESMEARKMGYPVRLEVDKDMPPAVVSLYMNKLGLSADMVYRIDGPLGLADLWQLLDLDRPDLKAAPFLPHTPRQLAEDKNIFEAIAQRDYLLYHPYDSFNVVLNFLRQAARDPNVLAIKITLYRIDSNSPIIDTLIEARQNGKTVTALVELKAKFDEQNNIVWARALEHAGVHVVYGLIDLKVHAKLCLVVRREGGRIVRYSHVSSGNYNAKTSRIYGDIGYLTANHLIGSEIAHLLNALTGYSKKEDYSHFLVAPKNLRKGIIERINREIEAHKKSGDGYIAFKLNGLVDEEIIDALYRASRAGVKIDLNVRGLCCLRPGVKDLSENIKVVSIVDRFLEHARIYYFRNGGDEEVLIGSADMMPRNLNRRIEVLFPVPDKRIKKALIEKILRIHLSDNVKARILLPDGTYRRNEEVGGGEKIRSQQWLLLNKGVWHED